MRYIERSERLAWEAAAKKLEVGCEEEVAEMKARAPEISVETVKMTKTVLLWTRKWRRWESLRMCFRACEYSARCSGIVVMDDARIREVALCVVKCGESIDRMPGWEVMTTEVSVEGESEIARILSRVSKYKYPSLTRLQIWQSRGVIQAGKGHPSSDAF